MRLSFIIMKIVLHGYGYFLHYSDEKSRAEIYSVSYQI